MKRLLAAAAFVAALAAPVAAKEITLPPLGDPEQKALLELLDIANKSCGVPYSFLLKRDLDPASTDNTPMWTHKAA
jgi:NAD-dependent oxidoreductase involved in siderophore biosynthesis